MGGKIQLILKAFLRKHAWALGVIFAVWGTCFISLFYRLLRLTDKGLFIGNMSSWGDWALHVAIANRFVNLSPKYWFSFHPYFADGVMTYPFVANLIPGILMKLGLRLDAAFIWPSIITAMALLVGMYGLFYVVYRSAAVSALSVFVFLGAGGMGFIRAITDKKILSDVWYKISELPDFSWYTSSVIEGMLVPQRAFLLGLTVSIWALVIFLYGLKTQKVWLAIVSGVLVGLLPIIHPHSLIAMAVIMFGILAFNVNRLKIWLGFALPAGVLGFGLYRLYIASGVETNLFRLDLGWTASSFLEWIGQWGWQWGLYLPIVCFGLMFYWRKQSAVVKGINFGLVTLFVLANIVQFQPVAWDNSKIFLWVYFGFSGLVSYVLNEVWKKNILGQLGAILLFAALTLTGLIEAYRINLQLNHPLEISNDKAIKFGEQIKKISNPTERFATAPIHNHPITVWASRPIILGYPGWVHNYGFDFANHETDLRLLYTDSSRTIELIRQYDISFVVLGPDERLSYTSINLDAIADLPQIYADDLYRVYDVRSLL